MEQVATLISASCTTGWGDLKHGELWLTDGGFLRATLGWTETLRRQRAREEVGDPLGPTVSGLVTRTFAPEELAEVVSGDARNLWIPRERLVGARLHRGVLNTRLRLDLDRGERQKLLWLNADPAHESAAQALAEWLGDAFVED